MEPLVIFTRTAKAEEHISVVTRPLRQPRVQMPLRIYATEQVVSFR